MMRSNLSILISPGGPMPVNSRTSIRGCCDGSSESRGISHFIVKVGGALTDRHRRLSSRHILDRFRELVERRLHAGEQPLAFFGQGAGGRRARTARVPACPRARDLAADGAMGHAQHLRGEREGQATPDGLEAAQRGQGQVTSDHRRDRWGEQGRSPYNISAGLTKAHACRLGRAVLGASLTTMRRRGSPREKLTRPEGNSIVRAGSTG